MPAAIFGGFIRWACLACTGLLALSAQGQDVVINEVMFHPLQPEFGMEPVSEEFIELLNRGTNSVDLTGWRLDRGVSFSFPSVVLEAGRYLVVAADGAVFSARHGEVPTLTGNWEGTLSNNGEEVRLQDAAGNVVDTVRYATEGDWAPRQRGPLDRNHRGWKWHAPADGVGLSLQLRNPDVDNDNGQNWLAAVPTPGSANTGFTNNIAPLIFSVAHSPLIPRSTQTVAISADLVDEVPETITVQVLYRVDSTNPSPFVALPMLDDGEHGDGVAGDYIYGAVLPAQSNNTVVEFYIEAVDGNGFTNIWPARPIPAIDEAHLPLRVPYALYQVDDSTYSSAQPLFKLIMIESERAELASLPCVEPDQNSNAEMNGTLISVDASGEECRHLCGFRNRGHHSRCTTPPNYRVSYPTDQPWKGQRVLNVNSERSYLQVFGSALARKAGLVGFDSRAVQVRVNNANLAATGPTMFGCYAANEVYNNDWAERHLPLDGDGNLYRVLRDLYPWGFDWRGNGATAYTNTYYKASNASENDWSDLIELHRVMGADDRFATTNVQAVAHVDEWMLHMAVMAMFADAGTCLNTGFNDDYVLYRGLADPRFLLLYYDLGSILGVLDAQLGQSTTNMDLFTSTADCWECGSAAMMNRFLHWPDFEPTYYGKLQHLIDTAFSEAEFNALVEQVFADYPQTTALATMQANLRYWMNGRRAFVQSLIEGWVPSVTIKPIATISGEPRSPTPFNTATLTIGGEGITHYIYKLNNDSWSAERPVTAVIPIGPLPDRSTNTVYVLGRTGDGVSQELTKVTVSLTWIIHTNMPAVRLNEVLARNEGAIEHGGSFPDVVELYNEGRTAVDLSGLRLTDDLTDPDKFVFPEGTTLPANSYWVAYADDPDGTPGFHLGFALNQQGDRLYLLDRATNGTVILDSVEFGLQLADLSIGRCGQAGEWILTQPTFGAANVTQALGNLASLQINEWLASGWLPFADDYVELLNPEALPVALGGLFLSDQPFGAPARQRIAPLSFILGYGHCAFVADGDASAGADHLGFRISSEGGEISLKDQGLTSIDHVIYGPQRVGIAQGRCPDGAPKIANLTMPTPGYANFCPGPPPGPPMLSFISVDQAWRYSESGVFPGPGWASPGFDDSSWLSGAGLLGRLRSSPAARVPETILTPLSVGVATTYYFRAHFTLPEGARFTTLQVSNVIDDGAVFYINGTELPTRLNMPVGPVNAATRASTSVTDAAWKGPILVPTNWVQVGDNMVAVEVHQINAASEDVMFGLRLDGVLATATPQGAGVVINEVLANNATVAGFDGSTPDWVEIFNPSTNTVDLGDMSLSDSLANPRRWVFPSPTILPPLSFLVVCFDADAPSSGTNTGFGLKTTGDSVYLFTSPVSGSNIVDFANFGLQTADFSIGRIPDGRTNWVLTLPTAGMSNVLAALGDPAHLRVNEWMALPTSGDDWFELFNPEPQPVAVGGLWLSDELGSSTARMQSRIPALSFIGCATNAHQRFHADRRIDLGADHVSFKLNGTSGDLLGLSFADGSLIHGVTFGSQQEGVSEGALPDGEASRVRFLGSPSPGEANFLVLTNTVINEVLAHSALPLEDAIELHNFSDEPLDLSGWWLSDSKDNLRKFPIPIGTVLLPGGFTVFYEYQFNDWERPANAFALSSAQGDQVYLSQTTNGRLSGWRAEAKFGASENGVSFGRYETSAGTEFVAMSGLSFGTPVTAQSASNQITLFRTGRGATNPYPKIGPVIISEIMYHPPDVVVGGITNDNVSEEFIELRNIIGSPVPLFDPARLTNGWRLRDAVEFRFDATHSIPPGGHLIVVSFDPVTNLAARAAFHARYGCSNCALAGPYTGKLDNSGESVELVKPGQPQPDGSVPWVLVEKVVYQDRAPWPTNADGRGASLQRVGDTGYGNDPTNWVAASPDPGPERLADTDLDGMPDDWETLHSFDPLASADAGQDSDGDRLTNLEEYLCGTDPLDPGSYLEIQCEGVIGGCVSIQFLAVAGKTYTVLYRDAVEAGPWMKLTDLGAMAASQTITIYDPSAIDTSQRFYRLVTPSEPR